MQDDKVNATEFLKSGDKKFLIDDYQGALDDYTRAINLKPDYADAYFNRARAKQGLGDFNGAIADVTIAVELEPAHAKHYCYRGGIKSENNDLQGGIGDFTKAVELNPNYATAYFNRAVAFLGLGKTIEAFADFMKAKEYGIRIPQGIWEQCQSMRA